MPIESAAKDGIRTIFIRDERLVEPALITRVFDDIHTELGKSDEDRVILDFKSVGFMASSALGKLIQLNKKAKEYKVKLKLSGIIPEVLEVFKITKLHKVFDIAKDEAAARKAHQKTGLFR
ncbi:MAG: STAS domain-containing protein [Planctomycetota bacterium]